MAAAKYPVLIRNNTVGKVAVPGWVIPRGMGVCGLGGCVRDGLDFGQMDAHGVAG